MAPNKRKILEAARKHAQKGAKDRALKEYERLLKLDPRDAKLRLEIGDVYRRWGQVDEAVAAYQKVAEQYMGEGFDARAVAVFKKIHDLDPERWESYPPLAELYQRMGLTPEAIQALQSAADGFHRAGRKREALELLRTMAALDPTNTASRIKVADMLRQEGMDGEAVAEYAAACGELERQGEDEAVGKVLERMLEVDGGHLPTLVQLTSNLLKRGFAERAEPFAKRALEADGDEAAHYELLADVYRAQQRDEELSQTYRALADLYRRRGDEDRARDIIQRFVPIDGLSAGLAEDTDPVGLSAEEPEQLDEQLLDEPLLDEELLEEPVPGAGIGGPADLAEETVLELADESSEPAPPRELDDSLSAPVEGDPDQLLAEASVYLRYGKRDQAVQNLEGILAADPGHRGALEKLGEAHADGGDMDAAVSAWLRAAERARSDGDEAGLGVVRDRIAALDPDAAASLGLAGADAAGEVEELLDFPEEGQPQPAAPPADAAPSDAPDAELAFDDEIEIDIDEADLEDQIVEGPAEGGVELPEPLELTPAPDVSLREAEAESSLSLGVSASMSEQINEDVEEAEFYRQQGLLDEAEAIYQRILQVAPNYPIALVRMGEIVASRGDDPGISATELAPLPQADASQPPAELVGEGVTEPGDLGDWTDGGLAAAADPVEPLAPDEVAAAEETDAGDTVLDLDPASAGDLIGESQVGEEAAAELSLEAEDAGDAASFDLAAELSEALDEDESGSSTGSLGSMSEQDVFSAVFSEFKKGVSKTLGDADHEAHYDLGIAYREMGLIEDAKGEFRAALACPERRIDALHMLGHCALEQGRGEEAAAQLEEALAGDGVAGAQALALRFDLGRAFAAQGDVEGARAAWEAVAAEDPDFCDVTEQLAALDEAKPDAEPPAEPADEGFETFRDLFEDDEDDGVEDAEEASTVTPEHESFDDLMTEDDGACDDDDTPLAEQPEVELEPAPIAEPEATPEPEPAPRRRRKPKISFV